MAFLSEEVFQPNKNAWDFITWVWVDWLCVYHLNDMISSYFVYLSIKKMSFKLQILLR